ncbi:site-specific integrase [Noviherbaspirillum galbum]|uniref:Site-specific integrase n=1 Tax=Noviherbaspirillum galbum TaxID=2709383 RepID=A0A6B3SWR8_9BURK|nr:site-specific integrase [Noviherbaspirillum galbum]NEX63446.1 site-specific integrase [Noviherbaspirillum galbum]
MRDNLRQRDLTFTSIPVGKKETPLSLNRLLYKGGASVKVTKANKAIQDGSLGKVLPDRFELVQRIYDLINGDIAGGGSVETAKVQISYLFLFFVWGDTSGAVLSIAEVERTYAAWVENLWHRSKIKKDLAELTAYTYATAVGRILDCILERLSPIVGATRIRNPRKRKTPQDIVAEKQSLHRTFAFGRLLQDICDGTPLSVIWESYPPVRIPMQQGGEIAFKGRGPVMHLEHPVHRNYLSRLQKRACVYADDRSLNYSHRVTLINFRIMAEMLMFIGQTGMNMSQAQGLRLRHFAYSSDIDGYKVRDYKHRRGGEVLFEIFSEYRPHFERYLAWRRDIFPSEERLFPIIRASGVRNDSYIAFSSIKSACEQASVAWTPPSALRGVRVNWLLRRSGDPDMTAGMSQHSKQTLIKDYEVPSLQRAINEVTHFHQKNDPVLAGSDLFVAVAPGECNGKPKVFKNKPDTAVDPNCRNPSGCLWCCHHRDLDSLEYVWSLACFRHLKILELSRQPLDRNSKVTHPAEHTIERISEKMTWFRESNGMRRDWVVEALARVEEGHYHDQWSYLIEAIEVSSA